MKSILKIIRIIKSIGIGLCVKTKCFFRKRDNTIWVFGEWFGKRCGDNCTYFANYVAVNHPEIKVYWIARKEADISALNTSIAVVEMGTKETKRLLMKAGVGIAGQGLCDFQEDGYNYLSGGTTILLWHGIPWKKIGHDGSKRKSSFFEIYKLLIDYVNGFSLYLSTSPAYDCIVQTAFGAKPSQIIRAGYPRNEMFYSSESIRMAREHVCDIIRQRTKGEVSAHTNLITYMPTFRNTAAPRDIAELFEIEAFNQYMMENDVVLIQKGHFVNQKRDDRKKYSSNKLCYIDDIDAQTLLCATDILITDYSSCGFDFLLLNRPIIYYLYDYQEYCTVDRGLYYPKESVVCGPIAETKEELAQIIMTGSIDSVDYRERHQECRRLYLTYENEKSSEIIFEELQRRL